MIKRLHPHFFVRTPIEIQLLPISHTKEDITSQYRQGSSGCDDLISKHKLEITFLLACYSKEVSTATGFHVAKKLFLQDICNYLLDTFQHIGDV